MEDDIESVDDMIKGRMQSAKSYVRSAKENLENALTMLYMGVDLLCKKEINSTVKINIDQACQNYRHDFGILPEEEKKEIRAIAKDWLVAWQKTF